MVMEYLHLKFGGKEAETVDQAVIWSYLAHTDFYVSEI